MTTNRSLISKAAIDTSTLGTGGTMNPEQQTQFMTFMKDYSQFLKLIGIVNMTSTKRYLDSIDVNKRAMRGQVEGGPNPPTGTVTHRRRALDAEGVIMPYDVTFQYMKENLEGDKINTKLAMLFSKQFANDSVDLAWNGDDGSTDAFLFINDGWLKIAANDPDTHKVDTEGSIDYLNTVFPDILASMPSKYYQLYQEEDKSLMKIFCSHAVNRAYKRQLQERNTALGDSMILDGKHITYDGHEIFPISFIPDNILIVSPFENLKYGIYGESLQVYHDVVPRKALHEYTLMGDFDMEIDNPDAFVIAKNFTI